MKLASPWVAAVLSVLAHLSLFGVCAAVALWPAFTPPQLIEPYGDSDREGFAVDTVSEDPGAYRQGDDNTPGGDGAEMARPAETDRDDPPEEPKPPESAPQPVAPPSAILNPSADSPKETARPKADGKQLPGAPGGANMRIGTPSRGGTVGSAKGARMIDQNSKPVYPEAARQAGIEGSPTIWWRIGADAKIMDVRLYKSSGHTILDEAALRWARTRRFAPAYQGNTPVESEAIMPVNFYLY
jgi:TonB family protein